MAGNNWARKLKRDGGRDEFAGQLPPVTVPVPSPTQEITIQGIFESLRDPEIGKIGVYGIQGTGKRTIMQHVMDRARNSQLFDISITVSVANPYTPGELLKEVANNLSLNVTDEDGVDSVAGKIFSYLENKKFLLHVHFLLATSVDPFQILQNAGFPDPTEENGCKLVVSSSGFHKSGDCRFLVKGLSREEALELFCEKAGEVINSLHLQFCVQQLVMKSQMKCIPLRINLLGGAMRDLEDLNIWEDLNKRNVWEFCYEQIPTGEIKNCFSFCSLFPVGFEFEIHELIEDWITEGLIDEEGGYKNGLLVLKQLLDRCLLHRVHNDRVTMHSTVFEWLKEYRDDKRFLVLNDQMPKWESIENLSMPMAEKILHCAPRCPRLSTLLLRGRTGTGEIPTSFFKCMRALRVLRIYETPIKSLPPSLSNLCNLHSLILRDCKFFKTLPDIRELKKLEQLDLSRTAIESLPPSISALSNLHKIIVRGCRFFKVLPDLGALEKLGLLDISGTAIESLPPSVSDLCNLQKLLARDCHLLVMVPNLQSLQKLEVLDLLNTGINEFPDGFFKLDLLRILKMNHCRFELSEPIASRSGANIYVSEAKYIRQFFEDQESHKWLQQFHFTVFPCEDLDKEDDIHFQNIHFHYYDVYLKAKYPDVCANFDKYLEISGSNSSRDDIIVILDQIDSLILRDTMILTKLTELGFENMNRLKDCRLERCHKMESIVSREDINDEKILESLQNLWISNLSSLTSVCVGEVQAGSFACLKHVYLDCCTNLEIVFSSSLTIKNLESLEIKFCDKLEKIFDEDGEVECSFPSLKSLILWELPQLNCVCEGILAPALEKLKVRECSKLKKLPLGFRNVRPPLEITGDLRWWNDLDWEDERIKLRILFREWGWF